ncbi:2OG-Fe(II) oxygenase [Magnetofaba australis]|nr:2OG-Fe(II) oxygenase [Magnetofaba australis]
MRACADVWTDSAIEAAQRALIAEQLATQGYCVIPNYLDLAAQQALLAEALAAQAGGLFRPGAVGHGQNRQVESEIRSMQLLWLDAQFPAQAAYLARMGLLMTDLNRRLFLGLRSCEAFFALYEPGDFYRRHCDNFLDASPRKVTAVLYLNADWQADDGGELSLFDGDGATPIARILPQAGTLACFLSRDFPHEVCVTNRQRIAIPTWLRNDDPTIPLPPDVL